MKTLLTTLLLLIATTITAQHSSGVVFINSFSKGIDYDENGVEIRRRYTQEQYSECVKTDTNYVFVVKPKYVIMTKIVVTRGEDISYNPLEEQIIKKDKYQRIIKWIETDPKSNPARATKCKEIE